MHDIMEDMTDKERGRVNSIEKRIAAVDSWIKSISQEGTVDEIDKGLLRSVLKRFGANFEIGEEEGESLSKYTNKGKRSGLDAVWGKSFIDSYKKWVKQYIQNYEAQEGNILPALQTSGRKDSGMLQFLGELTSFAAGQLWYEDFKRYTEARALNGRLWQEGRKGERVKAEVPTFKKPILLASFPPGFPKAAWEKITSSAQ